MVNKVILVGNLGRDPEVRSTPSGQQVASFTMATERRWKDKNGQRQKETEWHNIVVWGKQAEIAGQYLTKGKQIFLEGRLQTRSWDDRQTGEKKYRTEVVCDNFQMLGTRGGDFEGGQGQGSSASGSQSGPSYDEGGFGEPEDDDIPF
jgi:single-strand DNA-binding protein